MDRNSLLGMTTGAAFMFGFGIVWLLIGLLVAGVGPLLACGFRFYSRASPWEHRSRPWACGPHGDAAECKSPDPSR
jgi:hypothetical protein